MSHKPELVRIEERKVAKRISSLPFQLHKKKEKMIKKITSWF